MSNFTETIASCEAASGAGTKKMIIDSLAMLDEIGQRLVTEALDPYRVFGIRKFDMPTTAAKNMHDQQNFDPFFTLLDDLCERKLTGNAARDAVTTTLAEFNQETQVMLARVLNKDLRAGFSKETYNKIFTKQIPSFEVMLADKYDTDEEVRNNVKWPAFADAKYDGERTIAICTQKGVTYYSRSGKIASHVDGLFDNDLMDMRSTIGEDIIVDGERCATSFTETMNAKKDGNSEAKEALRFYTFFMMKLTDWKAQSCKFTMEQNRKWLSDTILASNCQKVILSKGRIVKDADDAEVFYKELVALGFEGAMLKDLNGKYEWKRSKTWIKWKPFFDFDGTVIDFYAGRAGTRLANTLGGITIHGFDEQGREFKANVGSGFNDTWRDEIWNNQEKYRGMTVTVKYQEISLAKNSEIYSLRFPTFQHFRDDK